MSGGRAITSTEVARSLCYEPGTLCYPEKLLLKVPLVWGKLRELSKTGRGMWFGYLVVIIFIPCACD